MGKQKFQSSISLKVINVLTFGKLSKLDILKDNELTIRNICHLEWEYKMIDKYGEIFRIFITKKDEKSPTLLLIIPSSQGVEFEELVEVTKKTLSFEYGLEFREMFQVLSPSAKDGDKECGNLPTKCKGLSSPILSKFLFHDASSSPENPSQTIPSSSIQFLSTFQ